MKRYGNLYEKIYDIENIELAHKNAKKGKNHYREVKMVDSNPDKYFLKIHKMLKNKTYRNSKYKIMNREMNNGKVREIHKLPYFPDRIIHHCIMQVVEPIWYKTLIRDTYSSLKGRGIHDGVKRIKEALKDKKDTEYCLKMDVTKFYPSIDNDILKGIIRRKIKDSDLLWLLDEIIDSSQGVPIGNYLSQYFGNLYLTELDHYAKEKLGCKNYFRYCDDIVILESNKKRLHTLRNKIENYLGDLNLELKDNYQIFPVGIRGIDFLGYKLFHGYTLLRKSIKKKFIRKIKKINKEWGRMPYSQIVNSIMSYLGWFKYANCKNLFNKYIDDKIFWIVKHTSIDNDVKNPLQGVI